MKQGESGAVEDVCEVLLGRGERAWAGVARLMGLLGVFALSHCSSKQQEPVTVLVTQESATERRLRSLEEQWEVLPLHQRVALEGELLELIEQGQTDPGVARARLLLGWLLFYQERWEEAQAVLLPLLQAGRSRVRDEAEVIQAAIENRQGLHEEALLRLQPLSGKLFSDELGDLYTEETIRAALRLRRWRLAVDTMAIWLERVSRRRPDKELWVRAALQDVPSSALLRILVDWHEAEEESNWARDWLEAEMIDLLATEAFTRKDPRLARDLLLYAPAALRVSERGDQLAQLAAQMYDDARVEGRLVGVVVGGESQAARRRSLQVAVGVLDELKQLDPDGRLGVIVEEDRGALVSSLGVLSAQGASLLIAGVDEEGARAALEFAELRQVPVLSLVAPPSRPDPPQYGFVLGTREEEEQAALVEALQSRQLAPFAKVGAGGFSCSSRLLRPGLPRFPVGEWSTEGVRALLVIGEPSCLLQVIQEAGGLRPAPWFAVGLESGVGPWPERVSILSLGAGQFPLGQAPHFQPRVSKTSDDSGSAPSWFEVLGRDAARWAQLALADLPDSPVQDEREVRRRHQLVRDALRAGSRALLSTHHKQWDASQRMPRDWEIVERPASAP